ncbi:hypothetical protein FACS1894202_02210 [Clostridia bacterium]|nr:hypothetical protein FACS1894202_02210 [Clostridia bacterium]
MPIELTRAQSEAATFRDSDVLVSAAAGSGKTRVLVERLVRAVIDGDTHIDDYLVITYTRAAAGELRRRIGKALSERGAARELARLNRAQIGTIHAFCAMLIRRFAVECGVQPNFRQLETSESNKLRERAMADALEKLYESRDPRFYALADTLSDTGRDNKIADTLFEIYDALRSLPDMETWKDDQLAELRRAAADTPIAETPWGALLTREANRTLETVRKALSAALEEMGDHKYRPMFESDLANLGRALTEPVTFEPLSRKRTDADTAEYYKNIRTACQDAVKRIQKQFAAPGERNRADFKASIPLAEGLFMAVRTFHAEYSALKARRNALDFPDLEHIARGLLARREIGEYREVLIDEYQDVNQVQEDILLSLKRAGCRLFMVGDARQSIYGFRQADPAIFEAKYNSGKDLKVIELPQNFRSSPQILDAVNAVCSEIMPGYVPLSSGSGGEAPAPKLVTCGEGEEPSLAAALALQAVKDGASPDDVAILLRTSRDMPLYKKALNAAGLACVSQEERLFDAPEVRALRACFQVLDNPRQDVPLLTLLRSFVYDFTPDDLAELRKASGGELFDGLAASDRVWDDFTYLRGIAADGSAGQLYHAVSRRLGIPEIPALTPSLSECVTASDCIAAMERLENMNIPAAAHGVRLSSIHRAKGLEFPVVILSGTAKAFNYTDSRRPVLFHKKLGLGLKRTDMSTRVQYGTLSRDAVALAQKLDLAAEEARLLYVALTRAEERLYVTAEVKSEPKALLSPSDARSMYAWLNERWQSEVWDGEAVCGETIVETEEAEPIEKQKTYEYPLAADIPSKVTTTDLARHERERTFSRPRFLDGAKALTPAERGTAAHAALQYADLRVCGDTEGARRELERLARGKFLTAAQLEAVDAALLTDFVRSPLGRRALGSGDLRRELPFSLLTPASELLGVDVTEPVLLQGVADLLFIEDGKWIIVDFKTTGLGGRDPSAVAELFRGQLNTYAKAVTRLMNAPVGETWIYFTEKHVSVLTS